MSEQKVVFDWVPAKEKSAFGKISRPVALIEIKSTTGEWKIFYPEVDSGSPITLLTEKDCNRLGFDLKKGREISLSGVLGGFSQAYVHESDIKIGREIIRAKIAFTIGKDHKQLLGRIDVFENFRVCLRGKVLQTSFLRE